MDEVQAWTAKEINWLEELRELSAEFPPAKQAMLTQLVLASTPAGGKVELEGLVDAAEVIGKLEAQLRDASHRVEGTGSREDKKTNPLYSWWFSESLYVSPEEQ